MGIDFRGRSIERWNWDNRFTHNGIHYSRYIASWIKAGNTRFGWVSSSFAAWLESVGCDDQEIHDILMMANEGKLELELSAERFRKEHEDDEEED